MSNKNDTLDLSMPIPLNSVASIVITFDQQSNSEIKGLANQFRGSFLAQTIIYSFTCITIYIFQ